MLCEQPSPTQYLTEVLVKETGLPISRTALLIDAYGKPSIVMRSDFAAKQSRIHKQGLLRSAMTWLILFRP